ncbi:MAG: discoidin domain-containing protein [Gemella sp.]|nr:discoidin domain-containing protein [Gemella sp.]
MKKLTILGTMFLAAGLFANTQTASAQTTANPSYQLDIKQVTNTNELTINGVQTGTQYKVQVSADNKSWQEAKVVNVRNNGTTSTLKFDRYYNIRYIKVTAYGKTDKLNPTGQATATVKTETVSTPPKTTTIVKPTKAQVTKTYQQKFYVAALRKHVTLNVNVNNSKKYQVAVSRDGRNWKTVPVSSLQSKGNITNVTFQQSQYANFVKITYTN